MADRRDNVDDWLSQHINPLPPPPGTFDLIKRRARRRKYRKLAITATSAAVIVAAAVTVPQVVNLPVLSPGPQSSVAAGQSQASSATPTVSGSHGGIAKQAKPHRLGWAGVVAGRTDQAQRPPPCPVQRPGHRCHTRPRGQSRGLARSGRHPGIRLHLGQRGRL